MRTPWPRLGCNAKLGEESEGYYDEDEPADFVNASLQSIVELALPPTTSENLSFDYESVLALSPKLGFNRIILVGSTCQNSSRHHRPPAGSWRPCWLVWVYHTIITI